VPARWLAGRLAKEEEEEERALAAGAEGEKVGRPIESSFNRLLDKQA